MEWLDAHAGGIQALATLVLVVITAYYAWVTRLLVRETRATLLSSARLTLQGRMNRISELLLQNPDLSRSLDEPTTTVDVQEARFHVATMMLAIFEEAFTQHQIDHAMSDEDWRAWRTTIDLMFRRAYMRPLWEHSGPTYGASFRRFMDELLQQPPGT
jgi:hypothetical protein